MAETFLMPTAPTSMGVEQLSTASAMQNLRQAILNSTIVGERALEVWLNFALAYSQSKWRPYTGPSELHSFNREALIVDSAAACKPNVLSAEMIVAPKH